MVSDSDRREDLLSLRHEILRFYAVVATTQHGINSLVLNWQSLSRISVRMYFELEEVYQDRYGLVESVEFVKGAMRFLTGVLSAQTENRDIEGMLMGAPNGYGYKHFVGVTRLAFVEEGGWLWRVGIDGDVVEGAMEVLEGSVTMEEGDALWGLFESKVEEGEEGTEQGTGVEEEGERIQVEGEQRVVEEL